MKTTVRPLCDRCRDSASPGHLEDPVTGAVLGRCPCRHLEATPADHLSAVAAAHPKQMDAAVRLIRDAALSLPYLSANDTREAMHHAHITDRNVIGAAFKRAAALEYIAATDRLVQSTDPATRHRILVWRSNICKAIA